MDLAAIKFVLPNRWPWLMKLMMVMMKIFVYGLLFVPSFISGAQTLVFSFTGVVPPNRCCVPGLENCTQPLHLPFHRPDILNFTTRAFPPKVPSLPFAWEKSE